LITFEARIMGRITSRIFTLRYQKCLRLKDQTTTTFVRYDCPHET
jgi:hypothetical protein